MDLIKKQDGIAIIISLIMLLIMSVMALTVSFMSNIDFISSSVYKRGQEAFLSGEACISEARSRFETIGIENLFFTFQSVTNLTSLAQDSDLAILIPLDSSDTSTNPADWNGPLCRSGPRIWDRPNAGPALYVSTPPATKITGRPIKNTSLPSGGQSPATLIPTVFTVVGKDSTDKDKDDSDLAINTGTEIAAGFETFLPGGATNVY